LQDSTDSSALCTRRRILESSGRFRLKIPEVSSFVAGFWNLPEDSGVKIPEVSCFVTGFWNLPEDSG
jgi:hypothetical protein